MELSPFVAWVVLPVLICLAKIIEVSIGTLRIIFLARRNKLIVPILGFIEVMIWLVAIGQIMQNLTNVLYYIAYGAGFALGNLVGILIEEKLAIGNVVIRIIIPDGANDLIKLLKDNGFGMTVIKGEGARSPVRLIFTVVKRKNQKKIIELINETNPDTFYTIDDVGTAKESIFPLKDIDSKKRYHRVLFKRRKKEK